MALLSNTKTPSQCRTFDCFRVSSGGKDGPGAECHRGHGPDGHRQHDGALGAPPLLHNQGHMIKTFTKTKTPENTFREHPQGAVTPPRPSVAFLAGIEWIRPVHSARVVLPKFYVWEMALMVKPWNRDTNFPGFRKVFCLALIQSPSHVFKTLIHINANDSVCGLGCKLKRMNCCKNAKRKISSGWDSRCKE